MHTAKQLSVSLVNKPGRLAAMLENLRKEKVAFRALSVMDSGERGTLRFVVEDFDVAAEVLDQLNVRYDTVDVLLVELSPKTGSFRRTCERLAEEHLNIDYAYCSFDNNGTKGGGLAVIKVNDLAKARRILTESPTNRRKLPRRRKLTTR